MKFKLLSLKLKILLIIFLIRIFYVLNELMIKLNMNNKSCYLELVICRYFLNLYVVLVINIRKVRRLIYGKDLLKL